ncbi:MAG: hypothetical protein CV081_11780 [Nitrospira sp. LK265]|nr:hypothetical protein [Nitrospira sp.]NGZ61164.1 hypothetical protein [Nitrospira sp. LK265]
MRVIVADTVYWLALANPFDHHHGRAVEFSTTLRNSWLLTTDRYFEQKGFIALMSDPSRY